MSRLKRQRLNVAGQDQVTARSFDIQNHESESEAPKDDNTRTERHPGRSLFVRSLPSTVTTESLATFFSQSFPIKHATVVVDPATKKSRCYGFVTLADAEDAERAQETFNQSSFEGQRIKVELAEPRHRQKSANASTDKTPKISKSGLQTANFQQPSKLIVRNLPWKIKEQDQLAALFRSYGKVKHVNMPKRRPGLSAGFGFVVLRGRKNAEKALEGLNGKDVEGRTLAVDWAIEKGVWETLHDRNPELEVGGQESNQLADHQDKNVTAAEDMEESEALLIPHSDVSSSNSEGGENTPMENQCPNRDAAQKTSKNTSSTLFVRNLPFTCTDETLLAHFRRFGAVRYARVVLDPTTERSRGTGFVCFFNAEDSDDCLREVPRLQPSADSRSGATPASSIRQSILEDTSKDLSGHYTIDGRVLHISRAVDQEEAIRLTYAGENLRFERDKDKRRLYLLSEGSIPSNSPLYSMLSATEIKIREDSTKQRQSLIKSNPTLHLSLTRLSIRNLPRNITSKDLKALAREAVVGFAIDVKSGARKPLSKEELSRGGKDLKEAEKARKAKGKGIVKQAKVVYEGREGGKVAEDGGAGRSRGYGFLEYSSHRWALMGLRWLNGHAIEQSKGTAAGSGFRERQKRLITEFAIENAQVVGRRQEREVKARERSRLISERRENGEIPVSAPNVLSRDQLMARSRKGMKSTRGKQGAQPDISRQDLATAAAATAMTTEDLSKASKRQRIIGRKRMMRRLRNKSSD